MIRAEGVCSQEQYEKLLKDNKKKIEVMGADSS